MMSEPELYHCYVRHEAVALFGSAAKAKSLCDGQWIIFPKAVVCLAVLGEPPGMSHFVAGSRFRWVADKQYRVGREGDLSSIPLEVVAGTATDRPIYLFVRAHVGDDLLYVGELAPSCMQEAARGKHHGAAEFELSPTLPSHVWAGLGGFDPGKLNHDAVDAALDRLRQPTTVEQRLAVLRNVVGYWHDPIHPADGMDEGAFAGLSLPMPLRWWYGWAGRRTEIMTGQNSLLGPDEVKIEDGKLLFYAENQWVYRWATESQGDDPPVYGRYEDSEPWEPEDITLSEHLILACLFEAVTCHCRYGASAAWLPQPKLDQIARTIPPIAVGPWRWLGPARFFARNGAFMYAMPNGEVKGTLGHSVWIGAKTEQPLQFLKPLLDDGWEYVAV